MHITVKNLVNLEKNIQSKINNLNYNDYNPKIIAVSKTFKIDHINPLIEYGHIHFGENKVQEALEKWNDIKVVIEYGMLSEDKFYDKADNFALYPTTEGEFFTINELKEKIKDQLKKI